MAFVTPFWFRVNGGYYTMRLSNGDKEKNKLSLTNDSLDEIINLKEIKKPKHFTNPTYYITTGG